MVTLRTRMCMAECVLKEKKEEKKGRSSRSF